MFIVIFLFFIAYLLGSINSAVLVCKLMNLPDPRAQGSGNPGATNVLRVGGNKQAALIVLLVDALKGFIPVFLAGWIGIHGMMLGFIALAAILGHMYPVFFNFQGGKGVATTLGALLGISLFLGIVVIVVWIIVTALTRYVSLASMCAAIAAPIFALIFGGAAYFLPLALIAAAVIYRHYGNIQRLRDGTETKLTF